ncbi:site-specific integrase [Pseudomonas fulva]|uniref:site-specific integrase n=1 Tax=Pseudomonas fulva TaxID=47880 RepID=UPI003461B44C
MKSEDEVDDDFEKLMQEIESESREAAQAYFDELYETAHGRQELTGDQSDYSELLDGFSEDSESFDGEAGSGQRIGNLKLKLSASPGGCFPVSPFAQYIDDKWVLLEGGEFTEVSIIINNARADLQSLKRAVSYYFLPATNPFGTIRSFVSSNNYADSFKYVERYVFEANQLDGSKESLSVISAGMLNEALDNVKMQGSAHAYNMLFFYINFWLALSHQKLIPEFHCLNVEVGLIDTPDRRQDIIDAISAAFVGWKAYSEEELASLLGYAYFWIDEGLPVLSNIREYLESNPKALKKAYSVTARDLKFENIIRQKVSGIEVVGCNHGVRYQSRVLKTGEVRTYEQHVYTWRLRYKYAIDRVRNALFILFCLMTGMRRKELAPLKFEDVRKWEDGIWRVDFSRYKTSKDPNYLGDPDFITIPDYLGEAFDAYKKLRMLGDNYLKGYVFQPAVGSLELNRTNRMIAKVARAVARETGIPQLHIHRFRKTIAELLINESEANIDVIRMIFGHSSYVMTLRYIARNPFIVASVVETLKEHFAEDFVNVVQAIHTGVFAGEAAHRIAEQVENRPELFNGKVLKTTIMQYVSHLLEGGSLLKIQRTSLGTMCLAHAYMEGDTLPPCLNFGRDLIYPVRPDFSNCHIECENNVVLQGSRGAIEHNIKFYKSFLRNGAALKLEVVKELERKIAVNESLLLELSGRGSDLRSDASVDKFGGQF